MNFDGATYEPEHDEQRLSTQYHRVLTVMYPGEWKTLKEIALESGLGIQCTPGISARLRDFRKRGHTVHRERVAGGVFRYRLEIAKRPNFAEAETGNAGGNFCDA